MPRRESLDGSWAFAADPDRRWEHPSQVEFDADIVVPFCPETARSGVQFARGPQSVLVPPGMAGGG